jgi:hypothetical protein
MHRYADTGSPTTFVAVVHDSDRVLFTASSLTRASLIEAIAEFVARNANVLLWSKDATRVQRLLRTGHAEAAIEHYFTCVGARWDNQWLVTSAVSGSVAVAELDRLASQRLESPLPAAG